MNIKAIITGSTGMVGKGLLIGCLENPNIESVLIINRESVGITHDKLKEIIHKDFFNLEPVIEDLKGYNTCFFCLGISSAGMSEQDYTIITYDLTINFAKTVLDVNPDMTFCYVSGMGTDSTENGKSMWARVKGKTENALLLMKFKSAYMFRPGFIQPMKGIKSKTKLYNMFYVLLKPFLPVFRLFPRYSTTTEKLNKAFINVVKYGYARNILESSDINLLADKY